MNITPVWIRVCGARKDNSLEVYFDVFFTQVQEKYLTLQGMDYMATIRRLGMCIQSCLRR